MVAGAFGAGVAMGTLSLARSSLPGVAYGATRALLALTRGTIAGSSVVGAVDTHMGGQRLRPTTLLEGVRLALVGIVTEPDRGFRTNGLLGLSRGLGAGLLGVLLKPTVGALSQVGGWTAALAASLDPAYDREAKLRMHRERPPRFFRPGSEFARLLPYRAEENRGKELIHRLRQGRHRGEGHVFPHVAGGLTVLVTRWRLMLLHTSKTPAATARVPHLAVAAAAAAAAAAAGPATMAPSAAAAAISGVEWEVSLDKFLRCRSKATMTSTVFIITTKAAATLTTTTTTSMKQRGRWRWRWSVRPSNLPADESEPATLRSDAHASPCRRCGRHRRPCRLQTRRRGQSVGAALGGSAQ